MRNGRHPRGWRPFFLERGESDDRGGYLSRRMEEVTHRPCEARGDVRALDESD